MLSHVSLFFSITHPWFAQPLAQEAWGFPAIPNHGVQPFGDGWTTEDTWSDGSLSPAPSLPHPSWLSLI